MNPVIPAKAGIQLRERARLSLLDPRFRGDDRLTAGHCVRCEV